MAAVRRIIYRTVGDGAARSGRDVKRLQILLDMLGYDLGPRGPDGDWGGKTRTALAECRANKGERAAGEGRATSTTTSRQSIARTDKLLVTMAANAGVLIPLPEKGAGVTAFLALHKWLLQDPRTEFSWHRVVWGLYGHKGYALVTQPTGGVQYPAYAKLNCSLYANLMMSVWRQGHCHSRPFDASIAKSGHTNFARYRYGYPVRYRIVGRKRDYLFRTAQQIQDTTDGAGPDRLYCLEKASPGGTILHMAMLLKGRVYECNYPKHIGCNDLPLARWMRQAKYAYLSGPSS